MARVRQALFVILAVAGLLSTLSVSSAAVACPSPPVAASAHHGCGQGTLVHQSTQSNQSREFCAACLAVLPSFYVAGAQSLPPFATYAGLLQSLSGIDPAIDPPPPRAA